MSKHTYSSCASKWQVSSAVFMPAVPGTKMPQRAFWPFTGDGAPSPGAFLKNPALKEIWKDREAPGKRMPTASELRVWRGLTEDNCLLMCDTAFEEGAAVIDVDYMPGLHLVLRELKAAGLEPSPFIVKSQNGGVHLYYRREVGKYLLYSSLNHCRTQEGEVPVGVKEKGKGLYDFKAVRAYMVAPGSGNELKNYKLYYRNWETGEDTEIVMTDELAKEVPVMSYRASVYMRYQVHIEEDESEEQFAKKEGRSRTKEERVEKAKRVVQAGRLREVTSGKFHRKTLELAVPEHFAQYRGQEQVQVDCEFCDRKAEYHKTFWQPSRKQLKCFGCMCIWTYRPPRTNWGEWEWNTTPETWEAQQQARAAHGASGTFVDPTSKIVESEPTPPGNAESFWPENAPYKYTRHELVSGFLPDIEVGPATLLASGTGQGKTHQLARLRRQAAEQNRRVIAVAPLKELVRTAAKRLDLPFYAEDTDPSAPHWRGDLAVTLASLGKLTGFDATPYELYIDESETMLAQSVSEKLGSADRYRQLLVLISQAARVVVCEAFPTSATYEMMAASGRTDWEIHTTPRQERLLHLATSEAATSHILADFSRKNRVAAYCASRAHCDQLAALCRSRWPEANLYVRHADSKPLTTDDYNAADVILYTQTLGTGVDISVKNHFTRCYAFVYQRDGELGGVTEGELRQAIARVRYPIDPTAIIAVKNARPKALQFKMHVDYHIRALAEECALKKAALTALMGTIHYTLTEPDRIHIRLDATVRAVAIETGCGWLSQYLCEKYMLTVDEQKLASKERKERAAAKQTAKQEYISNIRNAECEKDLADKIIAGTKSAATDEQKLAADRMRVEVEYGSTDDAILLAARTSLFEGQMRERVALYLTTQGETDKLLRMEAKAKYGSGAIVHTAAIRAELLSRFGLLVDGHALRTSDLSDDELDAAYVQLVQDMPKLCPRKMYKATQLPRPYLSSDPDVLKDETAFVADTASRRKGFIAAMLRPLGARFEGIDEAVLFAARKV